MLNLSVLVQRGQNKNKHLTTEDLGLTAVGAMMLLLLSVRVNR